MVKKKCEIQTKMRQKNGWMVKREERENPLFAHLENLLLTFWYCLPDLFLQRLVCVRALS